MTRYWDQGSRLFVALTLIVANSVTLYAQTWQAFAQNEQAVVSAYKQQMGDFLANCDSQAAALKAEKIKGYENEKEFKERIEKASEKLAVDRQKGALEIEQDIQVKMASLGDIVYSGNDVAIDLKAIDPETKTFPIILTIGAASASVSFPATYSIKGASDIRTAYYRFVDAYKMKKVAAEVRCGVVVGEIGKSYSLTLKSWRLLDSESNELFVAWNASSAPTAIAWFGSVPPKAFETKGSVTIQTTENKPVEVWIGGQKKGMTPLVLKGLPLGNLDVTFIWPGTTLSDVTLSEMIVMGPNPDIVVESHAKYVAPPVSRDLSDRERSLVRVALIREHQTTMRRVVSFTVTSVERNGGTVVVGGNVIMNVVDPRGGIATVINTQYRVKL